MKILVAEDDVTSRTILTAILKKWGFEPVSAVDGGEAWQIMQAHDAPILAVLDWDMPVMSGPEVCRRIRRAEQSLPPYLIILTAKGEKTDIVAGLNSGANDYISKPYDNEELQARLHVGKRMVELQTELLETRDALAHEATHDALTGALNRRAILDRLEMELKRVRRKKSRLSIGMCDIDFFKKVNDTYGHQVGDDVLCGFVNVVEDNVRGYDLVGRYGGEEFLIVAPDSNGSPEEGLYERLCARVADFKTPTRSAALAVTVSIGVAGSNVSGDDECLLAAADAALYRAKELGRNQVVYAGVSDLPAKPDDNRPMTAV